MFVLFKDLIHGCAGFCESYTSRSLLAPGALTEVYLLSLVPAFSRHQTQQVFCNVARTRATLSQKRFSKRKALMNIDTQNRSYACDRPVGTRGGSGDGRGPCACPAGHMIHQEYMRHEGRIL